MDLEFSSSKLEAASVNVSEANRLFGVSVGHLVSKIVDNAQQKYFRANY